MRKERTESRCVELVMVVQLRAVKERERRSMYIREEGVAAVTVIVFRKVIMRLNRWRRGSWLIESVCCGLPRI